MGDQELAEIDEIRRLVDAGLSLDAEDAARVVAQRKALNAFVFYHQAATSAVKDALDHDLR